jgi:hypothetical protein
MSDIIYYKNGEETFRISPPTPPTLGTKCPETKLEIKMTEQKFTLELTLDELHMLDKYVEYCEETKEFFDKLKNAYPKPKSPVEEAYKDWWGQYPELETDSKYDDTRWKGFKAGFQAAYEEKVREDDYYDEVECDEKDNPKPLDDVVNRLIEKHKSQKLWNILSNKYDYISATCDDIVSAVEDWLPKEQSAAGSQNVDTELLVDGFNHCLQKMKEMLR